MKSRRWIELDALLEGAWDLPQEQRRRFLVDSCDDPELRHEADSILAADRGAERFFHALAESAGLGVPDTPAPALSGRRIGNYRLLELLGYGGMGVVYAAERADGAFERQVAIKLLSMGLIRPEAHRRFLAERRILAGLEHPVIARLLDGGFADDGTPYFVMERVDGERVDRWCDRRRASLRCRLRLLSTLCGAVEFAHRRLIVHRDLKPGNVLVTTEGELKLLDFGVAKLLSEGDPDLTASGAAAPATPAWAAPEQLAGGAVTTATDTYALGALAYLLLVGVPPFEPETRAGGESGRRRFEVPLAPSRRFDSLRSAKRSSIAAARSTTPKELVRTLAGDLDAILATALAPEPERRYTSAAELAADLERHLNGHPVSVRPPSTGYRLSRFLSRHRLGVASASAVAVLGLGLVAVSLVSAARSREQSARIREQADRIVVERDRAEEVTAFLVDLFEVSDPDRARGREITARKLLTRGGERIRTTLGDQPATQAAILLTLGRVHRRLGELEVAAQHLEDALAFYRKRPAEWPDETVETLHELARAREAGARWDEAEVPARQALEQAESLYGPNDPRVAELLVTLGRVATGQSEYSTAEQWLRRALEIQRRRLGDDDTRVADTRIDLGITLHYEGRIDEAKRLFDRAASTYRRHPEVVTTGLGNALYFLANIALFRGEYDESASYLREGRTVAERLFGSDHHETAAILVTAAQLEQRRGNPSEAESLARSVVDIQDSSSPPLRAHQLNAMRVLAEVLMQQGRYNEAEATARRAMREAISIERPFLLAEAIATLGYSLREQGRFAESRAAYLEILENIAPQLPAERPSPIVARTEHRLGILASRQGRWEEALERQRRAVDLAEPLLSGESTALATMRLELADALVTLDREPEAREPLAQALAVLASTLGEEDERVQKARALTGRVTVAAPTRPEVADR